MSEKDRLREENADLRASIQIIQDWIHSGDREASIRLQGDQCGHDVCAWLVQLVEGARVYVRARHEALCRDRDRWEAGGPSGSRGKPTPADKETGSREYAAAIAEVEAVADLLFVDTRANVRKIRHDKGRDAAALNGTAP